MRIVISGTPGVGKHTISLELSKLLNDMPILDINKIILAEHLLIPSENNNIDVDMTRSYDFIKSILSKTEYQNAIIVGHLAPYLLDSDMVDFIVILRRSPYELKKVYEARSYSKTKINDNLVSEILGIISYDFIKKFPQTNIAELQISSDVLPSEYAKKIVNLYANKTSRSFGSVDWLPLVQNDPEMVRILSTN